MDKQEVLAFARQIGAHSCGVAPFRVYDELLPRLTQRGFVPFVRKDVQQRIDPFLLLPSGKSIIVCLFPYQSGQNTAVAKFAQGRDYHEYVKEKLSQICDFLGDQYQYKLLVDSGTLCDRHLAYLAGLGYYGRNQLLYADGIGSRFYIGSILTDLVLAPDQPMTKTCLECNACVQACIGGALGGEGGFDVNRCASYLTQTKQPLDQQQQQIKDACPWTLGCDICADVCPLNGGTYAAKK